MLAVHQREHLSRVRSTAETHPLLLLRQHVPLRAGVQNLEHRLHTSRAGMEIHCVADLALSGTKATSATLFSSSTKSTAASPLDNIASLG